MVALARKPVIVVPVVELDGEFLARALSRMSETDFAIWQRVTAEEILRRKA